MEGECHKRTLKSVTYYFNVLYIFVDFIDQVASLANLGSNYINAGQEARRMGTAHASIVPYQSFRTMDGYMTVGCGNDLQYEQVCHVVVMVVVVVVDAVVVVVDVVESLCFDVANTCFMRIQMSMGCFYRVDSFLN